MDQGTNDFGSKKRSVRRKLTPFLCREMLFDYATGRLTPDRKKDVETFLKEDTSTRESLASIKRGMEYSSQLGKTHVTEEVKQRLAESENMRTVLTRAAQWSHWPDSVRWSTSALMVSAILALIIAFVPWNKMPFGQKQKADGTIVLADIPKDERSEQPTATEGQPDEQANADLAANETSGDEHVEEHGEESPLPPGMMADMEAVEPIMPPHPAVQDVQTIRASPEAPVKLDGPIVVAKPVVKLQPIIASVLELEPMMKIPAPLLANATRVSIAQKPEAKPTPVAVSAADKKATDAEVEAEESATADGSAAIAAATETSGKSKRPAGFVSRAFMNLPNVQTVTPEIVEKLMGLGAAKAGEVELGWRRGEGSYFHFTVPESNEESMLEMLRAYGPVRISKDPHPRVMPEGQIRIILWIEPAAQ